MRWKAYTKVEGKTTAEKKIKNRRGDLDVLSI